jgi:DNA polymerase-3 subunit alpha
MVEKLDEAAARIQKGLRITLHDSGRLPRLSERLKGRPEGEVTLVLRLDGPEREVEIKLPGRYPINPQASGAIKAIPGVAEVELV